MESVNPSATCSNESRNIGYRTRNYAATNLTPSSNHYFSAPPSFNPNCFAAKSQTGVLKIFRRSEDAILPTRASVYSAGCDLYAAHDGVIPPGSNGYVDTDISVILPPGTYARIAPRSGLAKKHNINVGAGVLDADYTGNVIILLQNLSQEQYVYEKGDRVAQLICEKIEIPQIQETYYNPSENVSYGSAIPFPPPPLPPPPFSTFSTIVTIITTTTITMLTIIIPRYLITIQQVH